MPLDFTRFHPLDHWPWTSRCRAHYPHGWQSGWHHLNIAWQCRRREQVLWPFKRVFACPFGRHEWAVWFGPGDAVRSSCRYCPATRLPSEADVDLCRRLSRLDFD